MSSGADCETSFRSCFDACLKTATCRQDLCTPLQVRKFAQLPAECASDISASTGCPRTPGGYAPDTIQQRLRSQKTVLTDFASRRFRQKPFYSPSSQARNMASQQIAALQHLGLVLFANYSIATSLALLHGAFILLFFISVASVIRRGLGSRLTQLMLSLTIISFAAATVYWAATIAAVAVQIRSTLVNDPDTPITEKLRRSDHHIFLLQVILAWSSGILPIISDAVVIWRAWVLFLETRWVMIGPLMLLLATNLAGLVLYSIDFDTLDAATKGIQNLSHRLSNASLVLSLAANALATMMIGYKLWQHRTFLAQMVGPNQHRFRHAQNVLLILVESGVVYFFLQVAEFILGIDTSGPVVPGSAQDMANNIFGVVYLSFSGMYPTIVVVLVNRERSFVDTCGFTAIDLNSALPHGHTASARPATVGHLSFAVAPTRTTMGSVEDGNTTGENDAGLEHGVLEKEVVVRGEENGNMDLEKRQAKSAPF
ncbi:hypothetical protein Hypma_000239 [Hypsizygus marmoreus]|uniref:Uncharacterized protein n=1 Tax=Hypsizygus marmoreus TaxID=39966 RepID=A0A369JD48_HYPMA|nr:hypothetical protein Hypma_000239 [Hypsizygus marmoreus]